MKTYELARVIPEMSKHIAATDMATFTACIEAVKDASAKPLKKSTEVFIWRVERVSSNKYVDTFGWVKCNDKGYALTPTGREMMANHREFAWR